MNILLVLGSIILWGLWGFFAKISESKIGIQVSFWSGLGTFLTVFIYLIFSNQISPLKIDNQGVMLGIFAGVSSGMGAVLFYTLLSKHPAGILTTVTALYPIVTIVLSVLFLKEVISFEKALGLLLALAALFLLNL